MRLPHIAVECFDIKRELAQVGGLELLGLQLEGDEALQATVKEHEIDLEVLFADLHRVLRADEAEVATQLGEEASKMLEEGPVEIGFRVAVGKREELDVVGVLQLGERVGDLSQRC